MSELKKGFYLVTADGINTMLRWDGEDWVDMRGIRPCFKEVVQTRYCGENNPVFEQDEPVFWSMPDGKIVDKWALQFYRGVEGTPLYAQPQPRTWVGLTEEDIDDAEIHLTSCRNNHESWIEGIQEFSQAIEAKLKEKNFGE